MVSINKTIGDSFVDTPNSYHDHSGAISSLPSPSVLYFKSNFRFHQALLAAVCLALAIKS